MKNLLKKQVENAVESIEVIEQINGGNIYLDKLKKNTSTVGVSFDEKPAYSFDSLDEAYDWLDKNHLAKWEVFGDQLIFKGRTRDKDLFKTQDNTAKIYESIPLKQATEVSERMALAQIVDQLKLWLVDTEYDLTSEWINDDQKMKAGHSMDTQKLMVAIANLEHLSETNNNINR